LAGCVTIVRRTLFGLYFGALMAMELFLILAITARWNEIGTTSRFLFTAFAVLGLFMIFRADQARRTTTRSRGYVEHVGFTLVALFDAFTVIMVLNTGAPVWLVVAAGIGVGIAGHFVLRATHQRLDATTT
jgi:hypothetical protein